MYKNLSFRKIGLYDVISDIVRRNQADLYKLNGVSLLSSDGQSA